MFDANYVQFTFNTFVYGEPMHINPDLITHILHIPKVMVDDIPISHALTPAKKRDLTMQIFFKNHNWGTNLRITKCHPLVLFLHKVFTYNLFPTTHQNSITFLQAYLIDHMVAKKPVDPFVICYVMMKTLEAKHPKECIAFPVIVTKILQSQKV